MMAAGLDRAATGGCGSPMAAFCIAGFLTMFNFGNLSAFAAGSFFGAALMTGGDFLMSFSFGSAILAGGATGAAMGSGAGTGTGMAAAASAAFSCSI